MTDLYDPPLYSERLKRRVALAEEIIMLSRKIESPLTGDDDRLKARRTLADRLDAYSYCVSQWRKNVDGDLSL